jgi:anti-anti-sigma factor
MNAPVSRPGAAPRRASRASLWVTLPVVAVVLALFDVLATAPHLTGIGRLVLYFTVIGAAAYVAGLAAGLGAAALSVLSAWYYLARDSRALLPSGDAAAALAVFAAAAAGLAVWMVYARAGAGRRRKTEASHALLASVVETSDDAIFAKSLAGTILSWNGGAAKLYGYGAGEAIGASVAMLVPPDHADETAVLLDGIRRGESYRYETVRVRKDGGRVDVSLTVSPLRGDGGRIIGSSTVARDITERKRTETQLREHSDLLDLSYDAIFVWELEGGITFWNRGAEALYGYSRGEAMGRVTHDLLRTARPSGLDAFHTTLRRTGRWEGELRHRTKDGRELIVDSRHQLIERGGKRLVLEITRDITSRRREDERRRVLAEAGATLAKSLDVAETLEVLAGVLVPAVADLCGIHLLRDGAVVRRFVTATIDPEKIAVVQEVEARYPFNLESPFGAPGALRTGQASLHSEVTDAMWESMVDDPGLRDAFRRLGIGSAMYVPLIVRGRTLGAIGLATMESGRQYGPDDLAMAEDLASRAAFALGNALLHEAEQAARRDAERAADRVARLQKVTAALSGALTPQEVADFILAQGIPALGAAAGAVYLLDEDGTSLEMISSVDYPETAERRRPVMRFSTATPMTQSVKECHAIYMASAAEAMQRYPAVRDSLHPSPGARAVVPTVVRGRATGTLVFVFREPVEFSAADREFIESLAAQCAQALERSRLYAREHQVAAALQQALLPSDLPYVPGIVIDATHRAGSPGADVGGDWYDAFRLPDGRVMLAIGDVVGRGLEAAVTMGQIRQAVRAAALEGHAPAEILALVGRILSLAATGRDMTTAIVGVLDSLAKTFTYAAAGHPPPLLAAGGRVEMLPSGGLPLGFMDERPAPSWTVDLAPGAMLVLYTDGLIEPRRDATAGLAALCAAVDRQRSEATSAPAHAILKRLDVSDAPDDIALVAVAVDADPVERLDLTVPAEPASLPIIRHALQHVIRGLTLDEQRAFALTVAVGEAVNNVIEHAYVVAAGSVAVRAWRDGSVLRVEVADQGRWRPAREQTTGGRGLIVMHALVDAVDVETTATGTTVRLAMELGTPTAGAGAAAASPSLSAAAPTASVRPDRPPAADGAVFDVQFPIRTLDGAAVVEVAGDVDMNTVGRFAAALERAAGQIAGPLIVSLLDATYLDSRGVAALFQAAVRLRTNRRALYLVVGPGSPVGGVLEAVEIAAVCPVFASVQAAFSAVSGRAT